MPSLPALPAADKRHVDPARIGYPPTLPIEVVLKTAPVKQICEAYGLTRDDWEALCADQVFRADIARLSEEVKKDGVSFKLKARLQSEEYLKHAFIMIDDKTGAVPPSVKADMIKATWRIAGLEPAKADGAGANTNAFQINIHMEKP
jgi:hypothetical protein